MSIEKELQMAFNYLIEKEKKKGACWILEAMLRDFPDNAMAHYNRAVLACDSGEVEKAKIHYEHSAELVPHDRDFLKGLAHFYHVVMGRPEQALDQYKKALSIDPNDTDALMIAGHLSIGLRLFAQAQTFFAQLLAIEPWHPDVRKNLEKIGTIIREEKSDMTAEEFYQAGVDKAQAGDNSGAIENLQRAVEKDPQHALAHNDLGVLHYNAGEKDKALRYYERAAELDPANPVIQKNLGDYNCIEQGNIQGALEKYVQALNLNPEDPEALLNIGRICMVVGKYDDARSFFNNILALDPLHADARRFIDELDQDACDDVYPQDGRVLYQKAQTLSKEGDVMGAISVLEKLIAVEHDNAAAFNDLGVLYYQLGDKDKALHYYQQAAKLNPNQDTFKKNLADFYFLELGRVEDAMKFYVQVLENDPEDVECLIATGMVCYKMNKFQDARSFFEKVLEIEPWNANAQLAVRELENKHHVLSAEGDMAPQTLKSERAAG